MGHLTCPLHLYSRPRHRGWKPTRYPPRLLAAVSLEYTFSLVDRVTEERRRRRRLGSGMVGMLCLRMGMLSLLKDSEAADARLRQHTVIKPCPTPLKIFILIGHLSICAGLRGCVICISSFLAIALNWWTLKLYLNLLVGLYTFLCLGFSKMYELYLGL